ncbi:WD repeat domain-containing protein 83 [Fusarium oxysporum f. sp. albedinis]|nr:WD repeat domain-containing protein 83 [Fusarium oxysporum f. sp. albedinis]
MCAFTLPAYKKVHEQENRIERSPVVRVLRHLRREIHRRLGTTSSSNSADKARSSYAKKQACLQSGIRRMKL